MFCANCGAQLDDKAVVCVKCGAPTPNFTPQSVSGPPYARQVAEGYDWLTTLLLCIFLGGLGIHSFYTKKTGIGIVQLLTAGGCGIWVLIDIIMIVTDNFKDGQGRPLVRK
jgi:hypothetical protein